MHMKAASMKTYGLRRVCAVVVGVHAGDASSLGAFEQAFQQPQELVEQEVGCVLMLLLCSLLDSCSLSCARLQLAALKNCMRTSTHSNNTRSKCGSPAHAQWPAVSPEYLLLYCCAGGHNQQC
jgi:hypothetical protein